MGCAYIDTRLMRLRHFVEEFHHKINTNFFAATMALAQWCHCEDYGNSFKCGGGHPPVPARQLHSQNAPHVLQNCTHETQPCLQHH